MMTMMMIGMTLSKRRKQSKLCLRDSGECVDQLIVWCMTSFSSVFQLYCVSQSVLAWSSFDPNKSWLLCVLERVMCLLVKSFEDAVGKREIACNEQFLAPLAEGQWVIVMALCPLCVRLFVYACVRKLFLLKTSPQKLLTGLLLNFTGMFLRWSSFKFLQIIVFHEEFWLPWQPK